MVDNNIKELIKIPDGLDNAILKGFEEGKSKKKEYKSKKIIKRTTVAAAVVIASVSIIGVINPELVSAIPIVNRVFEYFNNSNFGYSAEKYKELGEVINETIDKNGTKVTLDQIVVDDNRFMATLIVESENLKGFKDKKNPSDFFHPEYGLRINGKMPSSLGANVTIINDTKGAVILTSDISNMNLEEDLKIDLDIKNIERSGKILAKGNWKYNVKTTKGINSEKYTGDKKIKVMGGEVWVDSLVKTPITNVVTIKGKYESGTNETGELDNLRYIFRDNNRNVLLTEELGGISNREGDYERKINILNDLENIEYIEVLQLEDSRITREIDNMKIPVLICTTDSSEGINRKEKLISRKPTQEELDRGYGLSSVSYYLNIDENKAFQPINDLISKEIKVNNSDKVIITNIDANEKFTKINMKIEGLYEYNNLSSLTIFDEDMKDFSRWEGHRGVVIENPETKEFSITLAPLDKNKKYTIAVPMTIDINPNNENRITVKLK
ncbi:hypothetical protein JCM1393_05040 [Clostridium carnis]